MKVLLIIAWRNLLRNKKRTFITASAVAFGSAALIFLWSFINGAHQQMGGNIRSMITGDIQIYPGGARGMFNYNEFIDNPENIVNTLKNIPGIDLVVPRLFTSGLVSSANQSLGVVMAGGDPDLEKKLLQRNIVSEGTGLIKENPQGIVLSRIVAHQLKAEVGSKVVLVAQDRFGSLAGESFQVLGIAETGSDAIDERMVYVNLPKLQELLSLQGFVTKILIRLKETKSLPEVLRAVKEKLKDQKLNISTWEEVAPMLAQIIGFQEKMLLFILVIVLSVVSVGVLNTLIMSFVERIREFGLLKALGTKDRSIALILFFESLWISLLGGVFGIALGLGTSFLFKYRGIDFSGFAKGFSNLFIGSLIRPSPSFSAVAVTITVVVISNTVISLYPAWKASRLEPVEAMRQ